MFYRRLLEVVPSGMRRVLIPVLIVTVVAALLVTGCGGNGDASEDTEAPAATEEAEHEHMEGDEHDAEEAEHMDDEAEHMHDEESEEHMEGEHGIPEEAASVPNPVEASEESVATGAALFAANCAVCHGDEGRGDGPTAAGLDPKPANLHEDHVQDLTDGGLFHIITHGVSGTAMVGWESVLSEEERWHVVNFLRTFGE